MNANLVPGAWRALTCQPALYLIGLATVSETESMPEQHPHNIDRSRVFARVDREPNASPTSPGALRRSASVREPTAPCAGQPADPNPAG